MAASTPSLVRLGLAAALCAAVLTAGCRRAEPDAPGSEEPPSEATVFEEVGETAGLDFVMSFLEGEQGARFKINLYDHGAGVSVADYDGDGLDDIYFLNQLESNALFRNRGDGTFEDVTSRAGVGLGDRVCTSAAFADYDNDGDQDLFVASTRGGNVLFRQDAGGVFTDVTESAGVALVAHSQGATFFDYDSDGWLDLFVTDTARWTEDERAPDGRYYVGPGSLLELVRSGVESSLLYRNRRDGTFEDVTSETGLGTVGWSGDTAVFDADGDGDQDLFVTNMFGRSTLFRNDDGKRFSDATDSMLGRTSWGAVGCKPFDADGDGLLDLFVVDMHSDMWMAWGVLPTADEARVKYGGPEGPLFVDGIMSEDERKNLYELVLLDRRTLRTVVFGNTHFRNEGGGKFAEVSDEVGLETMWPWGIATADFDMDGFEDVFIAAGMGYPYHAWPNELMRNRGDGTFESVRTQWGIDPRPGGGFLEETIDGTSAARSSRSAAVLDFDGDGRPDLVVNNFNERPYLYRNRLPKREWIGLRLRGTRSNRDAVGAVARLQVGERTQVRQVCAAGGYLAQSTLTLYFGLGDAATVTRCEIDWPSGTHQVITDLAPGRVHQIVEPDER